MISPDRLKAFLDDLALVSAKHGIGIIGNILRGDPDVILPAVVEHDGPFYGYAVVRDQEDDRLYLAKQCDRQDTYESAFESLNVQTATAHQRIALAKSLNDVRENIL